MNSILDRHRERFQATPGDDQAFEALEEHYFLAGDWNDVAALYEHRLTAPALGVNRLERAQIQFRLGQVFDERLGDPDRAIECFAAVLQDDPRNRPALTQLRDTHIQRENWDVALQVAEVEVELPMRPDERAALLFEMGSIWLRHLNDPEQSLAMFERALDEVPDHRQSLTSAAEAYEHCNRPDEAARAWERLTTQLKGPERAAAQVAQARLTAGALGEADRAGDLYRDALGDDPNNREAIVEVAAQTEARGQWPALADLLERRYGLESADRERAEIAARLGRLHRGPLDSPPAARMWFARAADHDSGAPDVYEALADLERERGDDAALFPHIAKARLLHGDDVPVWMLLELASLYSDRGDDAQALAELEIAVARSPEDALAIEALSDALARLGRDEELIEVLERRASLASLDPEACAAAHAELGALFEERLGDPESARRSYAQAFEVDPTSPGVCAALERLVRKDEDWKSLRTFLHDAGHRGPESERLELLCSLGALESDHFGDREAAVRALEAVLDVDPRHAVAHRGLQQLASEAGDDVLLLRSYQREAETSIDPNRTAFLMEVVAQMLNERDDPQAALEWARGWVERCPGDLGALTACADLEERHGEASHLIEMLERLEPLLPGDEQAAHLRRLGTTYDAAGRGEDARSAFERATTADPTDIEALELLAHHFEAGHQLVELAETRARLAELLPAAERAACLEELATMLADRLGDVDGAIAVLAGLQLDPHAPAGIADRYAAMLERAAHYDDLAAFLSRRAAQCSDPDAATAFDLRRADLLLHLLDRPADAADAYRAAHCRSPESAPACEGLEAALLASGDFEGLVAFLSEQIAAATTPAVGDRLAYERAVLLEDALTDDDQAAAEFRRLAAAAGDPIIRGNAARRLEDLLTRSEDWAGLRRQLETALAGAAVDASADLHERLATLCAERLDDATGALGHLESAVALDSSRIAVWRELALRYDEADRPLDQVRAIEAELAIAADRDREIALRARAAATYADALDDADRALAHFEKILALDSTHPAASEFVIAHCEQSGDVERLVALLEARLSRIETTSRHPENTGGAARCSLRLRIAEARAGALDDPEGAIAVLEPALSEYGARATVAIPLADLYLRCDYREELIDLCRTTAEACNVEAERANWFVRLGDVLCNDRRDRDAAAAYRQALTDRPGDRAVQSALCDLYRRLGEREPLVRLLEVELSHLAGTDEVPVRIELAELLARDADRQTEALIHLRRILEVDPGHHDALTRALELAPRLGASDALLELLDRALSRPNSDTERAALLSQRAKLLVDGLDQPAPAVALYREAIALDPTRSQDRTALRALLTSRSDWPAVLDALFEAASFEQGEARVALFEQAADLAWEHVSPDAALPWLVRIRSERPDDPPTLARISAVHRAMNRPEALLRALADEIAVSDQPLELHLDRARILESDLNSPERTIAALESAHAVDPRATLPLQQLERLYRLTGCDRKRARVLEALIETDCSEGRTALLCDAAALYAGKLDDCERAAVHLLTAVDIGRETALYPELLRELGLVLRSTARPDAWARCAEAELVALDPGAVVLSDRRRALRLELASVYEHELGRPDAALGHLRALVDLKWTETHGTGTEELDAIEAALIRLLRAQKGWIEFESRLAAHLERRADDADGWLDLARVREEQLRTPVAAADAYRTTLSLREGDLDAIPGLRRCSELAGDWETVARALQLELKHAGGLSARQRAALSRRIGDVSWHQLASTTRASRAYAAALEYSPADFESLRSHQRLLETMEDWPGALGLYESEVEMLGEAEPERRRAAALRAGEIARDHTNELERALRAYEVAARSGDLSAEHRYQLADLHRRNGDDEAYAEIFAAWCNDADTKPSADDQMQLARVLETLGRDAAALECVERAIECDRESAKIWDSAAHLRERCGDATGAAAALDLAADLLPDAEAAERLRRAAELSESDDAESALERFRAAARRDPADARTTASLARISSLLGDYSEAVEMASRTLDLIGPDDDFDAELLRDTALVGARAARERGNDERAALFYSRALAVSPSHADALAEYGETLAGLGDLEGARAALEERLAMDDADDDRALHLAMLGAALRANGEFDAAKDRLEAAIAADPGLDRGHDDLVRVFEELDRIDDGVAALEHWSETASCTRDRAERLLRAADWELAAGDRAESAERHLRDALEIDTDIASAWVALATLLSEQGRVDEALEVASMAQGGIHESGPRGTLALIQGRAHEQRGEQREAATAFGIAARENPRDIESALSSARLLRALGDWRPAADTLEAFAQAQPGDDTHGLADVLQQLGRLLAGPLEDVAGAISAYRRALELDPERVDTRTALAEFLSHRPEDRVEALAHHEALLAADPTHAPSLRVLLRFAREQGDDAAVAAGIGILRALGIATPRECEEDVSNATLRCAGDRELDDPLFEKLRRVCVEASREIARALEASPTSGIDVTEDAAQTFRAAAIAAEGELTAAALVPLTEQELGDALKLTAAIALDPDQVSGEGRLVNAMSTAIKRRLRRRLRKILEGESLERIGAIDFGAWRAEVRALASAVALDETGGDLRTALAVLVSEDSEHPVLELPVDVDLSAYIAACTPAQALLRRIVRSWRSRISSEASA